MNAVQVITINKMILNPPKLTEAEVQEAKDADPFLKLLLDAISLEPQPFTQVVTTKGVHGFPELQDHVTPEEAAKVFTEIVNEKDGNLKDLSSEDYEGQYTLVEVFYSNPEAAH